MESSDIWCRCECFVSYTWPFTTHTESKTIKTHWRFSAMFQISWITWISHLSLHDPEKVRKNRICLLNIWVLSAVEPFRYLSQNGAIPVLGFSHCSVHDFFNESQIHNSTEAVQIKGLHRVSSVYVQCRHCGLVTRALIVPINRSDSQQ